MESNELKNFYDALVKNEISLSKLYYNYKKTSDEDVREFLKKVKIVRKEHKGVGSVYGYYELSDAHLKKMLAKPRNISLTFDATNTKPKPLTKLKYGKSFYFLVKSSSRFFLKPDIAEVIDQIPYEDKYCSELLAICIEDGHDLIPDTEGEHFIMKATLLYEHAQGFNEAVKALYELEV
jgi:hypothetical protein